MSLGNAMGILAVVLSTVARSEKRGARNSRGKTEDPAGRELKTQDQRNSRATAWKCQVPKNSRERTQDFKTQDSRPEKQPILRAEHLPSTI
jgi:hypothetical protein